MEFLKLLDEKDKLLAEGQPASKPEIIRPDISSDSLDKDIEGPTFDIGGDGAHANIWNLADLRAAQLHGSTGPVRAGSQIKMIW
jgi:hypothetical protein